MKKHEWVSVGVAMTIILLLSGCGDTTWTQTRTAVSQGKVARIEYVASMGFGGITRTIIHYEDKSTYVLRDHHSIPIGGQITVWEVTNIGRRPGWHPRRFVKYEFTR